MTYPIAEKFKSVQGEGVYTGTPMAFIRLVGCSVGKKTCTSCDTDFERVFPHMGGGHFTASELRAWVDNYKHVCITGGEPLDRDLKPLIDCFADDEGIEMVHIETSGTVAIPSWLLPEVRSNQVDGRFVWLTVSPKPGWKRETVALADELKVILRGLGDGPGWMSLDEALVWANTGIPTFLQPRNEKFNIDHHNLQEVVDLVNLYPQLRLSVQMHKFIQER